MILFFSQPYLFFFFLLLLLLSLFFFFFFNDTATTEIYTLSLHDALPISRLYITFGVSMRVNGHRCDLMRNFSVSSHDIYSRSVGALTWSLAMAKSSDRKSTRLNSSHLVISYAVFCLKKKKIMS